jgi:uncharacterized protein (TIGR02611 family)
VPNTTDDARPADDQQPATAQPADDIAAADEHQGAIAKRVDALRERLDSVPGGRFALRVVVTIVGSAFVLAGIVMLVIPGPGWLSIFLGLAILGTEYAFARRINDWLRTRVRRLWAWWKARRTRA